ALLVGFAMSAAGAQTTAPTSCTLNTSLTVTVTFGTTNYPHTYNITLGANGTFTGTSTDNTETITGSLSGTTFTLHSNYSNGYTYDITGTLNTATGTITGTGTSSQNQALTFTINGGTTCTTTASECPAAPAVANAYLRSLGEKAKASNRQNIISQIAKQMGPGSSFNSLKPCDAGYAKAVQTWIDAHLTP
ncbi:MAG: hypothetical protein M3P26_00465, partial [Gemmatimonadota bacterium]|nr:hypothetical protein [Gemmatimonadota bacterium]